MLKADNQNLLDAKTLSMIKCFVLILGVNKLILLLLVSLSFVLIPFLFYFQYNRNFQPQLLQNWEVPKLRREVIIVVFKLALKNSIDFKN